MRRDGTRGLILHSLGRCALSLTVMLGLSAGAPGAAEVGPPAPDWPQWRGPHRDGRVAGPEWPGNLDGLEPVWRVALGKGYPGPIVASDRVFTVETVDSETAAVRALDREDGRELWRTSWQAGGQVPFFAAANGDWVRSTPAWDGATLYVGDMEEVLRALDGDTGQVRWQVDFRERFGTKTPDFGFASSPLAADGAVYVQAANSLVKLAADDGRTLWRALQHDGSIQASGAFSSPVMAEIRGARQLVVATRHDLAGVEPATGEVLWTVPVPSFRGMNILTPAIHDDHVFTSAHGGRSHLFRIDRGGDGWSATEVWTNKAAGYMSSPVVIDGHAYLHLGNSRLDCIDLATGESRWRSQPFGKYWSLAWQGDRILALDQDGALFLLRADPGSFTILDSRNVSEQETWGHLAVSGDLIVVRELTGVAAFRWRPSGTGQVSATAGQVSVAKAGR